jgi:hypothetical protein
MSNKEDVQTREVLFEKTSEINIIQSKLDKLPPMNTFIPGVHDIENFERINLELKLGQLKMVKTLKSMPKNPTIIKLLNDFKKLNGK